MFLSSTGFSLKHQFPPGLKHLSGNALPHHSAAHHEPLLQVKFKQMISGLHMDSKKSFLNWLENDGIWMYVIMFLIFNCHLNTSGQVLECHMTWLFNERLVSGWE